MFNKAWMAPAAIGGGTATLMADPWSNENTQLNLGLRQGGMLKRADGSYSQRGLWDNIRANAGSGKEPTAAMLAQERKINNEYKNGGSFQTSYYSSDVNDNYYAEGGSLPKPYSLPEDSFRQGARNLHNSIYASTPGQYPQPYENGGTLVTNSAMPQPEQIRPNLIPASAFSAPVEFYPETYADIEKSDGTTYKKGLDGAWYISGPRAKNYTLMNDPAGIWADSLETGIRQAKVVPVSQIPIVDNSYKV
jgi:hypothetical protein